MGHIPTVRNMPFTLRSCKDSLPSSRTYLPPLAQRSKHPSPREVNREVRPAGMGSIAGYASYTPPALGCVGMPLYNDATASLTHHAGCPGEIAVWVLRSSTSS